MSPWTQSDFNAYQARRLGALTHAGTVAKVDKERVLHEQALEYCKSKGWLVFHGSMAHSAFRTLGEPDLIVCMDNGQVLFAEFKKGTAKLTKDQQAVIAWLTKLGHRTVIARSLEDFVRATKDGFSDAMIAAGREG